MFMRTHAGSFYNNVYDFLNFSEILDFGICRLFVLFSVIVLYQHGPEQFLCRGNAFFIFFYNPASGTISF